MSEEGRKQGSRKKNTTRKRESLVGAAEEKKDGVQPPSTGEGGGEKATMKERWTTSAGALRHTGERRNFKYPYPGRRGITGRLRKKIALTEEKRKEGKGKRSRIIELVRKMKGEDDRGKRLIPCTLEGG